MHLLFILAILVLKHVNVEAKSICRTYYEIYILEHI